VVFFVQILRAVVENNLNASFVTVGLIPSVPFLNQSIWMSFTQATTFLRPDVTRILWLERVLESERAAFEKRMNASILGLELNLTTVKRSPDTEYAPIVYASQDGIPFLMVDPTSVASLKPAVENARDTGLSSMSPPDLYGGVWRMACYLAYYGNSSNGNPVSSSSLSTVEMRREACLGYLGASLAVELVFTAVLSRFIDDVEMDVVAAYVPSLDYEFLPTYNCTPAANSCELVIYDPAQRASDKSTVVVAWSYGFQNFELRCYSTQNLWLYALRSIIAWPLLMSILVLLLFVLIYLILKRLESFERDKVYMEKFNADLRAAKLAAEAADKAKSNFLATVSHEIRYIPLHPGMKLPMLL
jgi:histidine kinase 2/3/4 (cytokinin receptor)